MKKSLLLFSVLTAFLFTICIDNAIAGNWTAWNDETVSVNSNYTVLFTPGQAGNHKIEFLNQQDIYYGGWMVSAWGSTNDNPVVWHT